MLSSQFKRKLPQTQNLNQKDENQKPKEKLTKTNNQPNKKQRIETNNSINKSLESLNPLLPPPPKPNVISTPSTQPKKPPNPPQNKKNKLNEISTIENKNVSKNKDKVSESKKSMDQTSNISNSSQNSPSISTPPSTSSYNSSNSSKSLDDDLGERVEEPMTTITSSSKKIPTSISYPVISTSLPSSLNTVVFTKDQGKEFVKKYLSVLFPSKNDAIFNSFVKEKSFHIGNFYEKIIKSRERYQKFKENKEQLLISSTPSDSSNSESTTSTNFTQETTAEETSNLSLSSFPSQPNTIEKLKGIENQPKPLDIYKVKTISRKKVKQLKLYDIPKDQQIYNNFIPLNQLWEEYFITLINPVISKEILWTQKALKADFHGSIITVIKSQCPSTIGITGICVQETQNTFKLITTQNSQKQIPKVNSVFSLHLPSPLANRKGGCVKYITLYGNQLRIKSADRTVKKFKPKPTVAF